MIFHHYNDTLEAPRAATDEAGNLLWRENYAPFGKKLENENAELGNHIGYTGKPHERITGFTYLNARYYDPLIGRFMAVDPVGYLDRGEQYFQRYTYTDNNPYKYTDPSGKMYEGWSGLARGYFRKELHSQVVAAEMAAKNARETVSKENLEKTAAAADIAAVAFAARGNVVGLVGAKTVSTVATLGAIAQSDDPVTAAVEHLASDLTKKGITKKFDFYTDSLDANKKVKDTMSEIADLTADQAISKGGDNMRNREGGQEHDPRSNPNANGPR